MSDSPRSVRAIPHDALVEIVQLAVHAPSGDNAQPWAFALGEDSLTLLTIPGADATLYNFRERGSYLAHGAVIENIVLAAAQRGYQASVYLLPQTPDATARISFVAGVPAPDPLATMILMRATNRKPYEVKPLAVQDREAVAGAAHGVEGVEARLVEDTSDIAALAVAISVNERLLMENRQLHDFLFGMIRWSQADEEAKPGLYVKTMELPPPVQILFRFVLRYWPAVRALNLIGLSRFIPKQSALVYCASSAIGVIILKDEAEADFIQAGRAFERVWLAATLRGLQLQPVTAIPYLMQRVRAGETASLSQAHCAIISDAYSTMSRIFQLAEGEHIAMLFRLGYGDAPSATSAKAAPVLRT